MSVIVQVNELYDRYNDFKFGDVGRDIDTGEISYYCSMEQDGSFCMNNYLRKFDPGDPNEQCLARYMRHSRYNRDTYSKELPSELMPLVSDLIDKHIGYNKKMGYPVDMALHNKKTLSINYDSGISLFSNVALGGEYIPVENKLYMSVTDSEWKYATADEKEAFADTLLHELGHMKVSSVIFDAEESILRLQTGFLRPVAEVKPVTTREGDIFLKFESTNGKNKGEEILEEVFNDLECGEIKPDYKPKYPQFGALLDKISDGRLRRARYTKGINEYYRSMSDVINSREKADELLKAMFDSVFSYNREEAEERAFEILEEYIQVKGKRSHIENVFTI